MRAPWRVVRKRRARRAALEDQRDAALDHLARLFDAVAEREEELLALLNTGSLASFSDLADEVLALARRRDELCDRMSELGVALEGYESLLGGDKGFAAYRDYLRGADVRVEEFVDPLLTATCVLVGADGE